MLNRSVFFYKKCKSFKLILYLIFIFIIFIHNNSFGASEPELIETINSAFTNILSWILTIATPAAAVGVSTGIFMRKFSFGDEEKIKTGKKLVKGSLFSYAFLLATNLILSAIESLIS